MELHVAFLPAEAGDVRRRAAVVIDVLRATTSLLTLLERGCAKVVIASGIGAARRYAAGQVGARVAAGNELARGGGDASRLWTAGERGGLAPEGFDFGNSPAAFARAAVAGSRVVMVTTNGTRALYAVREAPVVLAGCLRNRSAAARAAVEAAARDGLDVTIVCAGREGRFSLDDAYTAGAIADAIVARTPGGASCTLTDAVSAARALYRTYPDAEEVFRQTAAGRNILAVGLEEDLRYCAVADCSDVVPRVGDRVVLLDG